MSLSILIDDSSIEKLQFEGVLHKPSEIVLRIPLSVTCYLALYQRAMEK